LAWRRHDAPPLAVYRDPGDDISFGDVFESEHLIDVYAAGDTGALGGGPMPRGAAERLAKQVNRNLKDTGSELLPVYSPVLELTDADAESLPVYSPALDQHADKHHALAHGSNMKLEAPNRAILLTDSCAVDTALVVGRRGRRKRGRLLFAPVVPATAEDIDRLGDEPVFGRFPLAACEAFGHGAIAELRYCFNVDVAEVRTTDRILALNDEAAEDLEVAWAAQTLRRGPLSTERNAERLTERLIERGHGGAQSLAESLGEAIDLGWLLESKLDAASDKSIELTSDLIEEVDAVLLSLESAARKARERLPRPS